MSAKKKAHSKDVLFTTYLDEGEYIIWTGEKTFIDEDTSFFVAFLFMSCAIGVGAIFDGQWLLGVLLLFLGFVMGFCGVLIWDEAREKQINYAVTNSHILIHKDRTRLIYIDLKDVPFVELDDRNILFGITYEGFHPEHDIIGLYDIDEAPIVHHLIKTQVNQAREGIA